MFNLWRVDFDSIGAEAGLHADAPARAELYRPSATRRMHVGEILLPMVTSMMRAK